MPKANQAKKTRQYSLEFKRKTVEMTFDPDTLIKNVAQAMDVHPFMLSDGAKSTEKGCYSRSGEVRQCRSRHVKRSRK